MRRRILVAVAAGAAVLSVAGAATLAQVASARSNVGAPVHQGSATGHTISVNGHGEVDVAPDMATLTVGVQTRGQDAKEALSNNSDKMNAVIQAIENQGVPASHIQTTDLSLWYDSEHDSYQASHSLTVRIDGVDKVGNILDAAVGAGANNSWGVSFGLKDPSAAKAQALRAAITDARSRADSMASALGVSISGVGSAGEASYTVTPPVPYAAAPSGVAASTPVQAGQLTVSADVNVVYTFG